MQATPDSMKYLTPDEMERLLSVIKKPRDAAIFRLAFHHGLSAPEIAPLEVVDYEMADQAGYDRLHFKRSNQVEKRGERLDPPVTKAIRCWLKKRGLFPGLLFPSNSRTPILAGSFDILMSQYCKKAAIPEQKAVFETLRHTCAMAILSNPRRSIVDIARKMDLARPTCYRYAKMAARAKALEAAKELPNGTVVDQIFERYYAELMTRTKTIENSDFAGVAFYTEYMKGTNEIGEVEIIDPNLGNVYFVETADSQYVKIGFSTQPRKRCSEFGTLRPSIFAIRFLGSFPASRATEAWLHEKFAAARDNGEWFRKTPELAALIASLIG